MRKSKFSEEQIAMALRQGEAGTPVADICRKLGISARRATPDYRVGSHGVPGERAAGLLGGPDLGCSEKPLACGRTVRVMRDDLPGKHRVSEWLAIEMG